MQKLQIQPLQKIDYKTMEEIKKLRTNISFLDPSIKVINITSAIGKEGKSLVAFWLAHVLAEAGKKVVLVDSNLRKEEIVDTFEIISEYETADDRRNEYYIHSKDKKKNKPRNNISKSFLTGKTLKKYLMGKAGIDEIIFESNVDNMHFILSGYAPDNPSELLSSEALGRLITYLRDRYDYVIVDTPAVGEVTDGVIIAKHCDGNLLVIEPEVVPYQLAQKVKEQLENSGTKVIGAVLNKV